MLYMKDIFEVWQVPSLFKLIDLDNGLLMHENDGLIFTVDACPYYPGTCNEIIKWKPARLNSIDFALKRMGTFAGCSIWGLYVKAPDGNQLWAFHVFDKNHQPQKMVGKISDRDLLKLSSKG